MDMIVGDWTNIDKEKKLTEISFFLKEELIAKIIFDFLNDDVIVEGDLSKVSEKEDNEELIKTYKDCSKEILRII